MFPIVQDGWQNVVACHPSFLHKLHSFNPYAFAIQYFSPNIICLT